MKKIIHISENDIRNVVKQVLSEKMGVPDNITETGEKIYNQIINSFSTFDLDSQESEYSVGFYGDFHINDVDFDEVVFDIIVQRVDDIEKLEIVTYQAFLTSDIEGTKIARKKDSTGTIHMNIELVSGPTWTLRSILDTLIQNKFEVISSLTHELKHAYDNRKIPYESFKSRSRYTSSQSSSFGGIVPLNDFFHFLYFIHKSEELTRSSQFYSLMKSNNVTKSQFKNFYDNNKMIETLRDARSFNLNNLVSDLHNYMDAIYGFFNYLEENLKMNIRKTSDENENIEILLDIVYQLTVSGRIHDYVELMQRTVNPFMQFLGKETADDVRKKQKMVDEYVKESQKYKNYRDFFGNEAKMINFAADKVLRKLAKLYDMAKDDKESSIVDWDLYHQVNKTSEKTLEEIKRLYQEGKIKISTDKKNPSIS